MRAAETVYEFGSSPDEDDDNNGRSPSSNKNKNKSLSSSSTISSQQQQQQQPQQAQLVQPTNIAGTNLRPNKTSSTSINQKLNTSFSSISDSHPPSHSPNPKNSSSISSSSSHPNYNDHRHRTNSQSFTASNTNKNDISISDDHIVKLNDNTGSKSNIGGTRSISNTSNTSLSSATNSSRGNVSQTGNQSLGAQSQKSSGHQPSSSSQQQNPNFDSNVISERVKNLATQIYQELKRIISRCNYDEDILSGLMPLIVRVLESLDLAIIENQQLQVELELCKDDNEQLVIMFEKEKAAKRAIDKKLIESEYAYEEERQQYQQKIESLDSVVKMFELKAKNASDQATRFEEKEAERKREYNKLHDRYTELLKSHCDVVERVRHLVGNSEAANLSSINVPQHMIASSSDLTTSDLQPQHLNKLKLKSEDAIDVSERPTITRARETLKSWNAETELTLEDASLVVIEDMLDSHSKAGDGSSHNESERATSEQEGEHEKEGENDSIAYTSMEKEFRKLIQENKDLLNTKNALNVVKDDLIAEVDRLSNEVSMYEQAVEQLNMTKDQMKQKVSALDTELRKTKEELEKAKQKIRENNEEGVPYSQRKRFGRAEMAKVLMERNNYKEKYMELQDAVRYTELVRANKVETEKRSGLWKFFSNLFGTPLREPLAIGASGMNTSRNSSPVVSYHGSPAAGMTSPSDLQAGSSNQLVASDVLQSGSVRGGSIRSINQRLSSNSDLIVLMDSDLNIDRSRAFKEGSGGRLNSELSGYIHAYGWSLPASSVKTLTGATTLDALGNSQRVSAILGGTSSHVPSADPLALSTSDVNVSFNKIQGLQVPIPQYCRPLTGDSLGMKIWCATAIDLSGGDTTSNQKQEGKSVQQADLSYGERDTSGSVVNISSSTPIKTSNQHALRILEQEVCDALREQRLDTEEGSSSNAQPVTNEKQQLTIKTTTEMVLSALPITNDSEELSTCVWICSTQHSRSKITIIDIKTKPNELLDSFYVSTFLYCIKSIPGSHSSDLLGITSRNVDQSQKNSITLNMVKELISTQKGEFYRLIEVNLEAEHKMRLARKKEKLDRNDSTASITTAAVTTTTTTTTTTDSTGQNSKEEIKPKISEDDAEISRILDNNVSVGIATLQKLNDFVAHTQPHAQSGEDESNQSPESPAKTPAKAPHCEDVVYYQPISTYLSTVWMGGKDSVLYIHSAIGQWKDCVACVKLPDSILQICHFRGRVFVALADGSLCVFFRNMDSKQWEFSQYLIIDINLMSEATNDVVDLSENGTPDIQSKIASHSTPKDTSTPNTSLLEQMQDVAFEEQLTKSPVSSARKTRTKVAGIRCLEIANKNLWVGYKNRVLIIDPITLKLKHTFNVVPQVDNQIRQLVSMKDGVFCCLRSDLILRLYSSLKPYQHIQNIDIEPVVTRLISPKTFVISHITAMKVADNTLWIGNAHGIILTVPCKLVPQISEAPTRDGSGEFEESPSSLSIARFVPKCDISNAQISFHGHKDAVKFFIHAHNLMLSGGQGYLDFRLDMDDQSKSISDKSHLILWQLPQS